LIKDNVIFKKILVAVDGSNPSLDAANQAIKLAKKHEAELTALYVVSPDVRYDYLQDGLTPGLPGPLKEILMMAMEGVQKHVDEVKQKASKTKIKVQTDVVLGSTSVAKAILDYAEQHNVDLIVIGTRGMSGIKRMLLGSTASDVVTYSHCPVLVVK
jgi:nucleotide-binding universal stress UspA family protein